MVGGLVQQQRRRIAEQRLRQQHAHLLAALQFAHLALVQRGFHAQAVEQHRGVGLRRVAALFADDSFEFAEAHAVLVGAASRAAWRRARRAPRGPSTAGHCP